MRKPGKTIAGKTYVHRLYEDQVVPADVLAAAKDRASELVEGYTCIRYDKRTGQVSFQFSEDFDSSEEPLLGRTVSVNKDLTVKLTQGGNQIWHHKWMWVDDEYTGFDVEASKQRSKQWEPHVEADEKRRIGYKRYWDQIRSRWE